MEENFETTTGYIIHESNLSQNATLNLRSKLSVLEFQTEAEIPKAFFVEDGYIFIPKINSNTLEYIAGKKLLFTKLFPDHIDVDRPYKLTWKPLEHQVDLIEEGSKHLLNSLDKRLCICLAPGLGKTFCTSAILDKLQTKFLFLVYSARIVKQAKMSMEKQLGSKNFYILEKGSDFEELRYDKIDGLYMTHSMFKTLIKTYGIEKVNTILFEKIGINTKILDEFDREVSSMYFMDAMMAFRYSIYLTGTKFKSLKPDDRLFQLIFRSVKTLGMDVKLPPNKSAIFVHYNMNPSQTESVKILRSESTFKTYYNNYIARKDLLLDFVMSRLYHNKEDQPTESNRRLFKRLLNEGGQIQFFCGRIENCTIVANKLVENFGIDPDDVGVINSECSAKEKTTSIDKPWLVTTSQSLGRGVDSDKVRAIVMLEFHFSLSELMQQQARVGRIGKKFGYFIYPVDHSFSKVIMSFNSKVSQGAFREGFSENRHLRVSPEFADEYINGYRKDSPEAKEILERKRKKEKQKVSKELNKIMN